ncbi:MAG: copper chaperone PCu(A)C [Rhizobiales bacterium]|nr:copper chaperone PCu(A)C [Hyphomicrobiales bacterium]
MFKYIAVAALALTFSSVIAGTTFADDTVAGQLTISDPLIRATAPKARVAGGFMTITNHGDQADRLISGTASFAGKTEIHEMAMQGEVMKMRQLAEGLEIPAGGSVSLMPGGYHIMFMKLGEQLMPGETRKVTVTFEKAGEVALDMNVLSIGDLKKHMEAHKSDAKHMHGAHSNN